MKERENERERQEREKEREERRQEREEERKERSDSNKLLLAILEKTLLKWFFFSLYFVFSVICFVGFSDFYEQYLTDN